MQIYTGQGRLVRNLELGWQSTGYYTVASEAIYWDGRNGSGELVSSGIYFYRLQAGDHIETRKIVILTCRTILNCFIMAILEASCHTSDYKRDSCLDQFTTQTDEDDKAITVVLSFLLEIATSDREPMPVKRSSNLSFRELNDKT